MSDTDELVFETCSSDVRAGPGTRLPKSGTGGGWGRKVRRVLGGAALALGLAQGAQAAVIFNNGAPDQISGTNMSASVVAEDFSVGSTTDITNLRFWSIQSAASDYAGSLSWAIYSNAGGVPGAVLQSGIASPVATSTSLSTAFGYGEFVFNIATSFQLAAGDYWLGLANDPLDPVDPSEMLWETTSSSVSGTEAQYLDGNFGWIGSGNDLAFAIDGTPTVPGGTVPEPGTLALLAISLAAAGLVRRNARPALNNPSSSNRYAGFEFLRVAARGLRDQREWVRSQYCSFNVKLQMSASRSEAAVVTVQANSLVECQAV